MFKNYYTCSQLAKVLGISRQAVQQKAYKGKLKFKKWGRQYLFPKKQFNLLDVLNPKNGY